MAKIVLSKSGEIVDQRFVTEKPLSIGRSPDNMLVVDDETIRPSHAVILPMVNDHFIECLPAGELLQVNAQKVGKHLLQNGDVIFFGAYRLKYINAASSKVGFDLTQAIAASGVEAQLGAGAGAQVYMPNVANSVARATRARFPRAVLVGMNAAAQSERFSLVEQALVGLDQTEQGAGAVVVRRPQGCYLLACVPSRAVKVNGSLVGRQAVLLKDDDKVEVGGGVFKFKYVKA